jgi:HAE1 family hydrophobic/amphiphilic exporter-1
MAAQFESLVDPFFILLTVPCSLIGVAFAMIFTGTTLSVVSLVGVILLAGIAVNNAIVLINYVNILRKRGRGLKEALVEAGKRRLRPILLTTATTILGLIPMSLGIGDGAELTAPIARAIMGGLIASTVLTLNYIPTLYYAWHGKKERAAEAAAGRKLA